MKQLAMFIIHLKFISLHMEHLGVGSKRINRIWAVTIRLAYTLFTIYKYLLLRFYSLIVILYIARLAVLIFLSDLGLLLLCYCYCSLRSLVTLLNLLLLFLLC